MSIFTAVLLALVGLLSVALILTWRHVFKLMERYYTASSRVQSLENELVNKSEALQQVSVQMKDTFQALAHQTLEGQTKQFLEVAQQTLARQTDLAKSDLEKRQEGIDHLLSPLRKTLDTLQVQTQEMERHRQKAYATVESELKRVIENSSMLSQETRALKNALTKPNVRGRWGEMQLKNCIELSGMSEFADVSFQDINDVGDDKKLIPDMVVKMPGGRIVIVDSKTPLDSFLASLEATSEETRVVELRKHGLQIKEHVKKLSQKNYNELLSNSADFTVLFLPNESFLYAALETQPDLVEYALEKKILIATPPTFIGLLKVIRFGWNEDRLAKSAEKIRDLGKEMHKRLVEFVEHYTAIGKHLESATTKYDEGLKRLNSRVLVQMRKMEKLGVKGSKELPEDLGYEFSDEETVPALDGAVDVET